jgi:hypothetical protein
MSTQKLFFPAGVLIDTTYLAHVGEQSIDQGLEDLFVHPSGDWAPNLTGSKSYAPEVAVETFDLTKAMDLMTVNALCAPLCSVDVDIFQRSVEACAMAYDTDESEHLVYRLTDDSLLCWEQIQVNQNDEAKISLKLIVKDNGSNEPLLQIPDQAIEDVGEQNAPFTLGPIEVITDGGSGTIVISGLKSFTWNNNCEYVKESADGDESPGFIALQRVRPVISFETTDLAVIESNFGATDQKGIGLDRVRVFFRRRRPNKINYADADAVHAKLEADTGVAVGTIGSFRWKRVSGDPARAACEIHLHRLGTAALFTYTKNVAITTGTGTTTTTTTTTTT